MAKYKISVSFDEKNFCWMVVDNGRFIRSPTKEDLIDAKVKYYTKTNICPICREEKERDGIELTNNSVLYPHNACHEKDKDRKETGRWVCKTHWSRDYNRYDPNGKCNIMRSLSDRRTGNQDPNSSNAKGDNFQELTCMWRSMVSTIPIEDLNNKLDNYITPIDHSRDSELGILQTKGKCYNSIKRRWDQTFINLHNAIRRGFDFDNLIFYCTSEDGEYIERIYIIPKKEIMNRDYISAYKYDNKGKLYTDGWYEKYRRIDENEVNIVNKIWAQILENRRRSVGVKDLIRI